MRHIWVAAGVALFFLIGSSSQAQVIQTAVGSPFSLFANKDFSAWQQQGNANWQITDQQVVMNQGSGWLIGRLPLADFELDTEYWLGQETQASLYVRVSNPGFVSAATSYQINLADKPIGDYGAGAIVGLAQTPPIKTRGRWNTLKVKASGPYLSVWLNGQKVVDQAYDTRFANGVVALHAQDGAFRIKSFNITIPGRW